MTLREINLIPVDKLNKKNMSLRIVFVAGCLTLCLSLIFWFYLYEAQVVLPKKRPVVTHEDIHKQMETNREEIKDTQQKIQHLSLRESLLKDSKARRINSKNSKGTTKGNISFFSTKPPSQSIVSLNPISGPIFKRVTISGSNFGTDQGSSYVRIGAINAPVLDWQDNQIIIEIPSGLSIGSTYSVSVHTSVGGSNSKTFTVQRAPSPEVSVSGIPDQINPNDSFNLTVTISNSGGIADNGGIAISCPALTATDSGLSPCGSGFYDTTQGTVSRSGGTISSGDICFYNSGHLADIGGNLGKLSHVLVDSNTASFTGSKTITLTVTPKISMTGFKVRVRGFMSVGGEHGYAHIYRKPSGSGTGIEDDQQQYPAYVYSYNIGAPTISSLGPTSGPIFKRVTISGSNFGTDQGSSYVRIGAIDAPVLDWRDNQIIIEIPSGLSIGSAYSVGVHTSVGGSNSKTFTVQHAPSPEVSVSGIPDQINPNDSFNLTVTISNKGGIADNGGVAISYPALTATDSGLSPCGSSFYDTTQGRVSRSGGTISSGDICFYNSGHLADIGGNLGKLSHVLVDSNTASFTGLKTITLTVTPKISMTGFKVRVRGFMSVGGEHGYAHIYRKPSGGGTGIEDDQQQYPAYVYSYERIHVLRKQ